MRYLYFFSADGNAIRSSTISDLGRHEAEAQTHLPHLPEGAQWAASTDKFALDQICMKEGVIAFRRPMQTWYDHRAKTLRALPVPCTLYIDNVAYPVNETEAVLDLTPGSYVVAVESPAFLRKTITLEQ